MLHVVARKCTFSRILSSSEKRFLDGLERDTRKVAHI